MDYKNLQIEALTRALRTTDGLCEWCVGCQKLGLNHGDDSFENDCLQSDNRGYDFVFDTERVAKELGLTEDKKRLQQIEDSIRIQETADFWMKLKETDDFLKSKGLVGGL